MPSETTPQRILVVVAHPDDVDFGSGGTIASWTSEGIDVAYCIITNGDAGGFDPSVPRWEMAEIRQAEQRAAAKVLGVEEIFFLGYPDGRLGVTLELRRDISRVIRQVRPDRVLCQCPERNFGRIYASHPDHLAAGEATLCAVYPDARNPFAHPELLEEGLEAYSVPEVWMMGGPQIDTYVDTTDHLDSKVAALLCHASQITDPDALPGWMRQWGEATAQHGGLPEGRTAESFQRVNTA
ncbi:MAG TPA: PIG-L deacetylase family protein [Acidimicrobiales bacterium]|nr:PIG-L deacetylase family protein [Acidimicrobiales bacterium]